MIKIKLDDSREFEFKTEETIQDKFQIKAEASQLAGGRLALAQLETALEEAFENYQDKLVSKYGKEEYLKKVSRLQELQKEKKFEEEYKELYNELNNNSDFYTYFTLQLERNNIYSYARLKVLCTKKPDGFDFYDSKNEKNLQTLIKKLEDEQVFFRR